MASWMDHRRHEYTPCNKRKTFSTEVEDESDALFSNDLCESDSKTDRQEADGRSGRCKDKHRSSGSYLDRRHGANCLSGSRYLFLSPPSVGSFIKHEIQQQLSRRRRRWLWWWWWSAIAPSWLQQLQQQPHQFCQMQKHPRCNQTPSGLWSQLLSCSAFRLHPRVTCDGREEEIEVTSTTHRAVAAADAVDVPAEAEGDADEFIPLTQHTIAHKPRRRFCSVDIIGLHTRARTLAHADAHSHSHTDNLYNL